MSNSGTPKFDQSGNIVQQPPEQEYLDPNWQIHRPWEIQLCDHEEWDKIAEDIHTARNMEKNLRCCANCELGYKVDMGDHTLITCTLSTKVPVQANYVCSDWGWDQETFEDRRMK